MAGYRCSRYHLPMGFYGYVDYHRRGGRCARSWACLGLALLAIALASTPAAAGPRIDAGRLDTPTSIKRANYEYHVLAGEMAVQRDRPHAAAREYVAALAYANDPKLARRATQIAVYANDRGLAYRAARAWAEAAPKALDAQRAAVRLAFLRGDAKSLRRYAPKMIAAAPTAGAGYRLLARLFSGEADRADLAIATLARLARHNPRSAPASYALGVVALRYDRPRIAAPAAARARRLSPHWHDAALLQAGVWVRQGHPQKARKLIAGLAGDAKSRARYHGALARMLVDANRLQPARDEFSRAVKLVPDDATARYGLAVLSLTLGDLERALGAFKTLYDDNRRSDDAAYYLGAIHEQRDQYAKAQTWYQRVKNGDHAFTARLRAARMVDRRGDLAGARRRLAKLRQSYPNRSARIRAAEGRLLFADGRYRDALKVYDRGLARHANSADLRYGRSLVYARLGRVDAAERDLRAMLARNHSDPRALNALGYMLTNHSHAYRKALGYIRRALAAHPDSAAIQDSMGWVQYHLGHLRTARRYLKKAYAIQPSAEIAAHLGEVRWRQGEHAAARRLWQHALADDPHDRVLRTTMQRFKQ